MALLERAWYPTARVGATRWNSTSAPVVLDSSIIAACRYTESWSSSSPDSRNLRLILFVFSFSVSCYLRLWVSICASDTSRELSGLSGGGSARGCIIGARERIDACSFEDGEDARYASYITYNLTLPSPNTGSELATLSGNEAKLTYSGLSILRCLTCIDYGTGLCYAAADSCCACSWDF